MPPSRGRSLARAQRAGPGCGCRCSVALCSPAETHGAVRDSRNTHEPPGAQSTSGAGAGENKPWSGGHGRRRSDQESAETNQRHGRGGKIVVKAASPGFADLKSVLISKYNSQCCAKLFKAPHTKTLILFSEQGCHIQSISG